MHKIQVGPFRRRPELLLGIAQAQLAGPDLVPFPFVHLEPLSQVLQAVPYREALHSLHRIVPLSLSSQQL